MKRFRKVALSRSNARFGNREKSGSGCLLCCVSVIRAATHSARSGGGDSLAVSVVLICRGTSPGSCRREIATTWNSTRIPSSAQYASPTWKICDRSPVPSPRLRTPAESGSLSRPLAVCVSRNRKAFVTDRSVSRRALPDVPIPPARSVAFGRAKLRICGRVHQLVQFSGR